MENMAYCRFENTLRALRECEEHWEDDTSPSEKKARRKLYDLCQQIADDLNMEVIESES